jgi:hypothetical protein
MSDCTCLARLERELLARIYNLDMKGNVIKSVCEVLEAVRAAQSAAPVDVDTATTVTGVHSALQAAGATLQTQGCDDAWTRLTRAEYDRLRASDKWAREVAVPALEYCRDADEVAIWDAAREALASRPKDAP